MFRIVAILFLLPSIASAATCTRSMCHRVPHRFLGLAVMSAGVVREFLSEPGDLPKVDWRSIDVRSDSGYVYLSYRLTYKYFSARKQTWLSRNNVQTTIDVQGDFGNRVDRVSLCMSATQSMDGTTLRTWLTAHTGWGDDRGLFPRWRPIPRFITRIALREMGPALDDVLAEVHEETFAVYEGRGRGVIVKLVDAIGRRRR